MSAGIRPVAIIAGTRPEVIKLAPVYQAFVRCGVPVEFWLSGQHRELADAQVAFFELPVAVRLDALRSGQSSNALLSTLLAALDDTLQARSPRAVIVQGDTTTALAGALAAFHQRIPIAHVEAGLRSGTLAEPFPEEMNRRAIDVMARWLFAPTPGAEQALRREGHVAPPPPTGNTGIDALHWAVRKTRALGHWPTSIPRIPKDKILLLSTGHRRESLGPRLRGVLRELGQYVVGRPELALIHVSHPNPAALEDARESLSGLDRVHVAAALNYADFVALMDRAQVAVSDSGGIQEEAPSFGLPVLITRNVTERPEVLECGGCLVGTAPERMVAALDRVLATDPLAPGRDLRATPFGDGRASERIAQAVLADLNGSPS